MSELAIRSGVMVQVDRVRAALAEVETIDEAIQVASLAEAIRYAAKQAQAGVAVYNAAAEVKLRAERRAGELLAQAPKNEGGTAEKTAYRSDDATGRTPTLADLGVSKHESSRLQAVARVPEDIFEEHVAAKVTNGEELTTAGLLRDARVLTVPISDEALARIQRNNLISVLDGALRALTGSPSMAVAEVERLLATGDHGPLTPSRFEQAIAYASAFAQALKEAGVDG